LSFHFLLAFITYSHKALWNGREFSPAFKSPHFTEFPLIVQEALESLDCNHQNHCLSWHLLYVLSYVLFKKIEYKLE
jgi:hypothetical protein